MKSPGDTKFMDAFGTYKPVYYLQLYHLVVGNKTN